MLAERIRGLNFRDLELFNKALLAKQVWRMLNCPNLLVSRVISGVYVLDCSILEAKLGANSF